MAGAQVPGSGEPPGLGLRAVVEMRAQADQLEGHYVDRARQMGWSWRAIATELGVTKQSVHRKYGPRDRALASLKRVTEEQDAPQL